MILSRLGLFLRPGSAQGDKWYKTSLELAWLRAASGLFPEKAVPVSLEMPLFLGDCGNNPLAHVFHSL